MVFSEFNCRVQLNLIDMQTQAEGDFIFIFVYQDHFSKHAKSLSSNLKKNGRVGLQFIGFFLVFWTLCVLKLDNGTEFCNTVITSLKEMWPELYIVHGKLRRSQSQGSVEQPNQDIKNILFTWMADHSSTRCTQTLRFVPFMKNISFHAVIEKSPYEAMFGCYPKVAPNMSATRSCSKNLVHGKRLAGILELSPDTLEENDAIGFHFP